MRNSVNESERRVLAHLDEAVLALAEALLKRGKPRPPGAPGWCAPARRRPPTRRPGRAASTPKGDESEAGWEQADYDVQGIVDRLNAAPTTPEPEDVTPRPPVTRLRAAGAVGSRHDQPRAELAAQPGPREGRSEAPPPRRPRRRRPLPRRPAKAACQGGGEEGTGQGARRRRQPRRPHRWPRSRSPGRLQPVRPRPRPTAAEPAPTGSAAKATGRPLVDRTPDLPVDDIEPVRHAPADAAPWAGPADAGGPPRRLPPTGRMPRSRSSARSRPSARTHRRSCAARRRPSGSHGGSREADLRRRTAPRPSAGALCCEACWVPRGVVPTRAASRDALSGRRP